MRLLGARNGTTTPNGEGLQPRPWRSSATPPASRTTTDITTLRCRRSTSGLTKSPGAARSPGAPAHPKEVEEAHAHLRPALRVEGPARPAGPVEFARLPRLRR